MSTLIKELSIYVQEQIDEEQENQFSLNYCDIPVVEDAINALNYVSIDFIKKYLGDDTLIVSQGDRSFEMWTWSDDYISFDFGNCKLYHSASSTTSGISTDFDESIATPTQVREYAEHLAVVIEYINTHYVSAIDTLIKQTFNTKD